MLEGGMGSHMPRFGLMHYLACFTLFDGDPQRINTILDGFLAVTPGECRPSQENISCRESRYTHRYPVNLPRRETRRRQ